MSSTNNFLFEATRESIGIKKESNRGKRKYSFLIIIIKNSSSSSFSVYYFFTEQIIYKILMMR